MDHRNALLQAAIDFSVPPVRAHHRLIDCLGSDGGSDSLLVFDIEPSESLHANRKDEVFLRVGDENRRLTFSQRQELLYDKGQSTYEARPVEDATLEELDRSLVEQYATALGALDADRMLEARGLASGSRPTVAGLLMFGAAPQRHLPEAFIRVLRYQGRSRGTGSRQRLLHDVKLDGPLPAQLVAARQAVAEVAPSRRALRTDGTFGQVGLVPDDAWLEAIVNAAVHRSYSLAGDHIRIEVFDDRMEVSSPGRFPGLVDLSDPLHAPRYSRNPRIARICADLHFGQELGEGIRRMFEEMRQAGLEDPSYHQTSGGVRLTLSAEPVDRELEARLPPETRAIVGALREAERLSTGELVDVLGLARPTVRRRLEVLRRAGLVEWVGKSERDPRAYWRLPPA